MAHEGSLTGTANNGSHEDHPDPSKGKVDAAHQRAETPVILEGLEQMSSNSGLHNSPALHGAAPPYTMLEGLALGQIHNQQMYSSTPSRQGDRDDCMMRIMVRLDDLRELNQHFGVKLERHASDINQKVGEIKSSVSALEQELNEVKDEQKMMGMTVKANSEAIKNLQKSTGQTADTAKSNRNETKGLQNQVSDLNDRLSKLEDKALQPGSRDFNHHFYPQKF